MNTTDWLILMTIEAGGLVFIGLRMLHIKRKYIAYMENLAFKPTPVYQFESGCPICRSNDIIVRTQRCSCASCSHMFEREADSTTFRSYEYSYGASGYNSERTTSEYGISGYRTVNKTVDSLPPVKPDKHIPSVLLRRHKQLIVEDSL